MVRESASENKGTAHPQTGRSQQPRPRHLRCRGPAEPRKLPHDHFQHETIGLELEGSYSTFQRRLVRFLRSHGMENFTISLVTDYHPSHPEGKRCVYLGGLDILSEKKRRQVIESMKRRERRLRRQLEEMEGTG